MASAAVLTLIGLLIAFVIFGIVSLVSMQVARKSAAPFFPTPTNAIRDALRAANLKPGQRFYDLGAGTGKVLLIAEKEFGARATGFEISILFYLIAKINLFVHGSHATIVFKSFWEADLRAADVTFLFLAERTMAKIATKLKAELRPSARVIVYAFPLPDRTPTQTIAVRGAWKIFVYKN